MAMIRIALVRVKWEKLQLALKSGSQCPSHSWSDQGRPTGSLAQIT
jgi:hypothetical protein